MAQSIVNISRELEEAQAQIAIYEVERTILMAERDDLRVRLRSVEALAASLVKTHGRAGK